MSIALFIAQLRQTNIPEPGVEMVWLSSTRRGKKNILANDADANEKNFPLSQGNAVAERRLPYACQCSGRSPRSTLCASERHADRLYACLAKSWMCRVAAGRQPLEMARHLVIFFRSPSAESLIPVACGPSSGPAQTPGTL